MNLVFTPTAWEDYLYWHANDHDAVEKIHELIKDIRRDPFKGLGKPEPLKYELQGWWSPRIKQEDRLVYRVVGVAPNQQIQIAQCRYHY